MYDIKEEQEKVILVGVELAENDDTEESLAELAELAKTAGAETLAIVIQKRDSVQAGTYIGKGKIEEVRQLAEELGATGIITDDELTPAQLKNLEDELQLKVMDRTLLILDIFAQRASTSEGKIQVELAQLKYRASRLVGLNSSLSRLGGGIGTRGPGEKKLEVDRRLIRNRISQLNGELEQVVKNREVARALRSSNPIPVIAIVGYTNAGKSTLLNRLTDAGVLEEDKLFATLDPTTRNYTLETGEQVLFTDTVGFIRKLPHHLVDAFRSTLEEAKYSDIIIHVVDESNEDCERHIHVVHETLNMLGVKDKTIITVFNKQDRLREKLELQGRNDYIPVRDMKADYTVRTSASRKEGFDELLGTIGKILSENKVYFEMVVPYKDAGKIQSVRKYGRLVEEEYVADGISIKAYLPKEIYLSLF